MRGGWGNAELECAEWIYDEPDMDASNTVMQESFKWQHGQRALVQFATLNRLVLMLTEPDTPRGHPMFLRSFLYTYRNFTTPHAVLHKLIQRYHVLPPPTCTALELAQFLHAKRRPVQRSVCQVIHTWLKEAPLDFVVDDSAAAHAEAADDEGSGGGARGESHAGDGLTMVAMVRVFCGEDLARDGHLAMATRILTALGEAEASVIDAGGVTVPLGPGHDYPAAAAAAGPGDHRGSPAAGGSPRSAQSSPPKAGDHGGGSGGGAVGATGTPSERVAAAAGDASKRPAGGTLRRGQNRRFTVGPRGSAMSLFANAPKTLIGYDAEVLAAQFTYTQATDAYGINAYELLVAGRNKTAEDHLRPHVVRSTQRFRRLNNWVTACVVGETDPDARLAVLCKLIDLASAFLHFNNFNGVAAVFAGLQSSSVHRLTKTFDRLDTGYAERLAEVTDLMRQDANYKRLRRRISKATGPCIPYLGVYVHDLVIMSEVHPTFAENDPSLINFDKACLMFNAMWEVIKHQKKLYSIQPMPDVQLKIMALEEVPEKKLYEMSLAIQPRGAK